MQTSSVTSFNSCSNTRLAGIAAQVVEEFGSDEYYDEFYFEREENNSSFVERETGEIGGEDEIDREFEFVVVNRDSELSSPVSADEIFCNGQIRPVYPISNRDLFLNRRNGGVKGNNDVVRTGRLPLRRLFIEERETTMTMAARTSSSSSSEGDELEGVPAEMYCVWRPKAAEEENGRCRKSNSAGSNSKRWKIKDLLHRSVSDGGKVRFVSLSASFSARRK